MATQIQFRRGTKTQHNSFTGATAEVTVNTTNKSLHVHDGTTQGGFEQAKVDLTNVSGATNLSLSGITTTNSLSIGSTQVISSARQLQNIVSLDATTTATIESAVAAAPNDFTSLNISGLSTFSGITTHTTSLFGRDASFSGVITATSFVGAITGAVTGTATSTTNIPNLTGAITSNNTTTSLGSFSSANLSAALTDETGTGVAVFATSPTLVTPVLGAASATSINSSGIITASTFSGNLANTLTLATSGTGLSGSTTFNNSGASSFTVTSNATNNNTNSTIVARDASGNFSAGTITASLTGTATSTTNIPNLTGAITSVNTATSLGSFTSLQLLTALSDETGSGAAVFATSPTLVTPALGTPSSGTLTNCTSLPISGLTASTSTALGVGSIELGHATDTTISRVSAGVVAIEGVNVVTTSSTDTLTNKTLTSPTLTTPALGTPSSGTLTSCTGLPVSTGISGLAANVATFLATPSSANLISAVTDETGTGALVFATSPTLVTPVLGSATATSIAVGSSSVYGTVTTTQFASVFAKAANANATSLMQVKGNDGTTGMGMKAQTGANSLIYSNNNIEFYLGATIRDDDVPSGGTLIATIGSTGLTVPNISASGIITATSGFVGNLTGTASSTTNIPNLTGAITSVNTTTSLGSFSSSDLATALTDETGSGANVFATSPTLVTPALGAATATSIVVGSGVTINASGIIASAGIITASQLSTGASGTGINITTNTISGPATLTIDPAAVGDNTGAVRIKGDLYVDGTQFIVNSTTIELADFVVGIASTATTDALADGAGIRIGPDNNLTYDHTNTALKSSENFNVASGKTYKINGTDVLSSNTLGSGIVASSLTSVGTLTNLNVGNVNSTGIITATTFVGALTGTATSTTNIPNLTGDITSVNKATTLATVNSNVGTFGSGGSIPTITVNAKGLVTGVTTTAVNSANDGTLTLAVSGTGLSGSASFTANQSSASTFTVTSNATNANTVSTIVARDGSGNFSAGTITASLTGTASSTTNIPNLTGAITSVNTTTSLGSFTSTQLATSLTDETGSGAAVFATSPTLVTPALGTPSSGNLANCTFPTLNQNTTGTAGTATRVESTVTGTTSVELVRGNMADNDHFRILVSGIAGNAGFAEIATADDGTEPIHVRQYTGVFSSLVRTATLLDGSGNTSFPNSVTATTFVGALTGTASSTTNIPNLTGDITSVNSVTSIAAGVIVNADINASAAIAVSKLAASTISGVTLGNNLNALTISTGLSGSSYNGSGAVTIAIDSTVATLTGTQTLTNKTLTSPTLTTPALGTPSSGTLTSCTGLPVSTGISGLGANVATFLATPSSANLISAVTDETGSGALVFATSPTLVTPALGTPASGTLTSCTGLPLTTGVTGTLPVANGGTGVTTSTGTGSVVLSTSPTLVTPLLGTPTSGNLANCTFPTLNQNTSGSAATLTTGRTIAITGDLTYTSPSFNGSGNVTAAGTLATVNSNVGTFGNGTSIPTITVNAKGLITGVTTTAVTSGTTITDDTSTNATRYLPFTSATSGSISAANVSSTKLTFNPSTGALSATDFNSTSDISLKDNIQTIVDPLDKIIKLNGVTFNWKENQKPSIGVIAQELEKVLPELVTQGDVKSVNYNGLIGVLIEAVKEQQKQIDELKAIVKNQ